MVPAFNIGLTAATNHSGAEFQNQTHLEHHSKKLDFRNNNAVGSRRRIENAEAKGNHFVERSVQSGRDYSMEDTKSLFSPIKCKNNSSSREKTCENHVSLGTSFKPKISKGIHKISTPWLVVGKERNHIKSRNDRNKNKDNDNDNDNNNDATGGEASTRDNPATDINVYIETKMETNNTLQPLPVPGKRNDSATGKIVSALKSGISTTKYEPSSHHNSYHIFLSNASSDFTGVEIQRIATENRDDIDSNGKHFIETTEKLANYRANDRQYDGNIYHNDSPEYKSPNKSSAYIAKDNVRNSNDATLVLNNHKGRGSRTTMAPSAMHRKNRKSINISSSSKSNSIDMQITSHRTKKLNKSSTELGYEVYRTMDDEEINMKCSESKILTPRRRTSRSPSPSRLRRNLEVKQPAAADYNRKLLMGLEMQRDMDRMSLTFMGARSESTEPSNFRIERKPSRENMTEFSILPSSMSCLNPTLQLGGCQTTENDYHRNCFDKSKRLQLEKRMSSPTRSRQMTNNFCSGTFSALLFDVKDNDPLWKFYDDFEGMHQRPNTEKPSLESKASDSREYQKLPTEKDSKNFETIGKPIDKDDRFDKFGRLNSNNVIKDYKSKDELISKNSRSQIGHGENQTSARFESDPHLYTQNQTTDIDVTQTRYFIPRDDHHLDDDRQIEDNTTNENNSKNIRYKSLMRYPQHLRYDQEKSVPNKKAMLDQMRHAIQNASARLESSENVKSKHPSTEERYSVMTMETECSDESSYASYYHHKQRTRLQEFDSE